MKAIRSINAKAKSQRGASLPLVLLLFLICAVTASIVMTAGTAAAGRAVGLTDSDQAYYSVTSTVNLFRDQLAGNDGEGHKVMVAVKKSTLGGSTSYQVAVTTDGVAAGNPYSVLERAAVYLLFGESGVKNAGGAQEAAGRFFAANSWDSWSGQVAFTAGPVGTFDITHSSVNLDDAQQSALALKGDANIDNDGNLVLTLRKPAGNDEGNTAAFSITCETDIESGIIEASESGSDAEIKFATITWVPSAVEKG